MPSPPVVLGICAGYQMLGVCVQDPLEVESTIALCPGFNWLPVDTTIRQEKVTQLSVGTGPGGESLHGYEIRHGHTRPGRDWSGWLDVESTEGHAVSARDEDRCVFGTSLHGLFEDDAFRAGFLSLVSSARGRPWRSSNFSFGSARERQIDRIADACASHFDTGALWRILG
jgi:adenosylcobyric acid synthase